MQARILKLVHELKERRFIPLLTGYLAGGWVALEVVDQLTGNEVIPLIFYPIALTLLVCGILAVGVVAWFHGAKGDQKPPPIEIVLLAGIGAVSLAATGFVAERWLTDPEYVAAIDRLDATEDPRRLAVTYFDPIGGSDEAELLASGLTEALIDELSRVPEIHVVSRNGVAPLRGRSNFPTDSVAEALQVGTFVRGTVGTSDSLVRVRVEVVRAKGDRNVGSQTFERPRSELFELQDDIAAQVALFLRETVGEEVRLVGDAPRTENVDSWMMVQEATEREVEAARLVALEDPEAAAEKTEEADSLLAEAGRVAPEWSVPPTRRGWLAYQQARWGGFNRAAIPDLLDQGLRHAGEALARNPADADALELRATIKYWSYLLNLAGRDGEQLLEEAEADFYAATEAEPKQASAYSSLSHLLMNRGRTAQAKIAAERSYEADPWLLNANLTLWRLFQASLDLQDEQEARGWCDAGAERFPDDPRFYECRVWLYALPTSDSASRAAEMEYAWDQCEAVVEHSPPAVRQYNRKTCEMLIALGLVRAGLADSARAVALRARAGPSVDPVRDLAWLEGIVLTWLGDHDAAVERLALYLAANPGQAAAFARDDTWWLEDLRSHDGYRRLLGIR